jgi:two-component system chemotaxis sensor kinase CheA
VEVTRRGDRVAFVCHDDGRGVDLDAERRVARRRGLAETDAAADSEALLRLLLSGGISTSADVTEVSGRGIGLDVVRETASRLGGEVAVRTEVGRGTTFELVVPVSLASVDAVLVEASGRVAAIPLDAVRGARRVSAQERARTGEGESICVDGASVPFAPLARLLSPRESSPASAISSALVVHGGGQLFALGVDRLVGTLNVVLRPLPPLAPVSPVVAGTSLAGDGSPQLVLAPEALALAVQRLGRLPEAPSGPQAPILVVDDSLTTRMLEQSILESAGYTVELAASGEEALALLRVRRYRLVLVDVEMPGMDGFSFVERLRGDERLRDVPAILVTSRSAPSDRQRGEAVGADAYITKGDFDQNVLLEHVRRLST